MHVDERQAFLLQLPVEVHRRLKELALKERRSMTAQAVIAIEEHLDRDTEGAKA
jgi:predicted transcriptional regulator